MTIYLPTNMQNALLVCLAYGIMHATTSRKWPASVLPLRTPAPRK